MILIFSILNVNKNNTNKTYILLKLRKFIPTHDRQIHDPKLNGQSSRNPHQKAKANPGKMPLRRDPHQGVHLLRWDTAPQTEQPDHVQRHWTQPQQRVNGLFPTARGVPGVPIRQHSYGK